MLFFPQCKQQAIIGVLAAVLCTGAVSAATVSFPIQTQREFWLNDYPYNTSYGPVGLPYGDVGGTRDARYAFEYSRLSAPSTPITNATLILQDTNPTGRSFTLAEFTNEGPLSGANVISGTDILTFTPSNTLPISQDVTGFVQSLTDYQAFGFYIREDPMTSLATPEVFAVSILNVTYSTVPEIDASSGTSALTLLAAVLFMCCGQRVRNT